MVIAVVWRKKLVSRWEFMAAGAVCAGLIIFAKANAKLEPDFNPVGIGMVVLSVCADAFIPNLQVLCAPWFIAYRMLVDTLEDFSRKKTFQAFRQWEKLDD